MRYAVCVVLLLAGCSSPSASIPHEDQSYLALAWSPRGLDHDHEFTWDQPDTAANLLWQSNLTSGHIDVEIQGPTSWQETFDASRTSTHWSSVWLDGSQGTWTVRVSSHEAVGTWSWYAFPASMAEPAPRHVLDWLGQSAADATTMHTMACHHPGKGRVSGQVDVEAGSLRLSGEYGYSREWRSPEAPLGPGQENSSGVLSDIFWHERYDARFWMEASPNFRGHWDLEFYCLEDHAAMPPWVPPGQA